jgi:carbonic anhydrase
MMAVQRGGRRRHFIALCACMACGAAAGAEPSHHWSYSGPEGPSHWGGSCEVGKAQSPIDIRTAQARPAKLPTLVFDYGPAPLHIINNGHTVQVDVANGSTLSVGGVRFQLVQFHFHKPSEETINGRHFDMVVHLVHRDWAGHLAVVAVPLRSGAANALVTKLWSHLPKRKEQQSSPAGVTIDPAQLLPTNHSSFSYSGSLTTPPCTEGVRWFVMRSPASISPAQIATFGKLYSHNARPTQPMNGREVLAGK